MHRRFRAPSRRRPRRAAARPPLETLEARTLLAALPAPPPEAQVNTFTRDHQRYPSVATDASGDYVVTWESYQQEDLDWNIYAQRYAADGSPRGPEFRVNQVTTSYHTNSSVAMDDAGNFVVVWTQGPHAVVYGRMFRADGSPKGDAFVVDWTAGAGTASVAMDADGNFVIAWDIASAADDRRSVFAQYYVPNGDRMGIFQVSTNVAGSARKPDVAMDADGDFAVTFEVADDPLLAGTYLRSYRSPARSPLTPLPETRVSAAAGSAAAPAVAMAADGKAVVTWSNGTTMFARQYPPLGLAGGGDIVVGTADTPFALDVAADGAGSFVVSWSASGSPGNSDVFARGFAADGGPASAPFRLNSYVPNQQANPAIAMTDAGGFVSAWNSWGQDGDLTGVFAREFAGIASPAATVVGRRAFYNHSALDGNNEAANAADDAAVATNKLALLPGGTASFFNVTSYTRGINGVMVDLTDLPSDMTLDLSDFAFRSGTTVDRSTWAAGPEPLLLASRELAPGRRRVTLVWPDFDPRDVSGKQQAVANGWLEVTLKANGRTNLTADDVFYFGNLIGETGGANPAGVLEVNSADVARARAAKLASGAAVTNPHDFNRDGRVNVWDLNLARGREGVAVPLFSAQRIASTPAPLPARPTSSVRGDYVPSILS